MNLGSTFQASFISAMGIFVAQSDVLKLMNLMKGKSNSGSNSLLPPLADEHSVDACRGGEFPDRTFIRSLSSGAASRRRRLRHSCACRAIARQKRHGSTTAKPDFLSRGDDHVLS